VEALKDLHAWLRWGSSNKRFANPTRTTFRALKALQQLGE
jgi:hypothetical protein